MNRACEAAGVSSSAFYDWEARELLREQGPTDAEIADAYLRNAIVDIHAASRETYGEPRITPELADRGIHVDRKTVAARMREMGIRGVCKGQRRRGLTKPDTSVPPAPDLVRRQFVQPSLDLVWCGDITYLRTGEGWLYLATVLDLGSRRLLGFSMGVHHDAQLVVDALEMAVGARGRARMPDTIFHSDRGSEYSSGLFERAARRLGVRRSMGRTGSCLDNAVAESWFATMKSELPERWPDRASARRDVFAWIHRYNFRRRHSTLGMLAPAAYEDRLDVLHVGHHQHADLPSAS